MLQTAVVHRRRRRAALRWSCAVVLVSLVVALGLPGAAADPGARLRNIALETVRDDTAITARYAAAPHAVSPDTRIGDEQLLELLRSAGRPTGLIRVGRQVTLTDDVTDEVQN